MEISPKSIELLNENGYKIRIKGDVITIHQSGGTRIVIIILGSIFCALSLVFIQVSPLISILFFLVIFIISVQQFNLNVSRSTIQFNLQNQFFYFGKFQRHLSTVQSLDLDSELKDEYTSAFKETSEEHHITISIKLEPRYRFNLLTFKSDYAEPSTEIIEILNWLKKLVNKASNKR